MSGRIDAARKAHFALLPLIEALYTANHPGPLKDATALIGHTVGKTRAPLRRAGAETMKRAEVILMSLAAHEFQQ